MRTLLVPLSGSALAERVLGPAAELARRTGAVPVLLRVVPFDGQLSREEVDAALSYLTATRDNLANQGLTCDVELLPGDPADGILFSAVRHRADLVVLSMQGRSGVERFFSGSVAEKVLQDCAEPVLLVPPRALELGVLPALDRLLIPLDGSRASEEAAAYVAREALGEGATVSLLHVVEPLSVLDLPLGSGLSAPELELVAREQERRLQRDAEAYLTGVMLRHARSGHWEAVVRIGSVVDAILAQAKALSAGMMVLAAGHQRGFDRLLHGSTATDVLRRARCPVLLVHDRDSAG